MSMNAELLQPGSGVFYRGTASEPVCLPPLWARHPPQTVWQSNVNSLARGGRSDSDPLPPWEDQLVEVVGTTFGPNLAPKALEMFSLVYGGGQNFTSPSLRMLKMLRISWGIQMCMQNRKKISPLTFPTPAPKSGCWDRLPPSG